MDGTQRRKKRTVFLTNASKMRKRGTLRARQTMVASKVVVRILPLVPLSPIERYRLFVKEECARPLSDNIRTSRFTSRRDAAIIRNIVDLISRVTAKSN